MSDVTFTCLAFDQLCGRDVHEILALRQNVFIIEQQCFYEDADANDLLGHHVIGHDGDGEIVAYCRLLPSGTRYRDHASIGRVVTSPKVRGGGFGKQLMTEGVEQACRVYPDMKLRISAQSQLVAFYTALGFVSTGKEYLEDGQPHTEMDFQEVPGGSK